MNRRVHALRSSLLAIVLGAAVQCPTSVPVLAANGSSSGQTIYAHSYALVVGIGRYPSKRWPNLTYPRKDAEGMAKVLRNVGFEVTALYDEKATARAIVGELEDKIAPRLVHNDRVLFFFSGHGHTQTLDKREYGYLIPYDGGDSFASYVSMELLRSLSEKMSAAKHQAFIIDACFGGQFAPAKSAVAGIAPSRPNYIGEITRRSARQYLTAGGKDQQVLDGGPQGYSYFTGYLIAALRDRLGDLNGDGYITMNELAAYLVPRATNAYQTPGVGTLPGHGLGEFVFVTPPSQSVASRSPSPEPSESGLGLKGRTAPPPPPKSPDVSKTPPTSPPAPNAPIASIPPGNAAERERLETYIQSETNEIRHAISSYLRQHDYGTLGAEVTMIWYRKVLDRVADGYTVRIQYEANVDFPRNNRFFDEIFVVRLIDGEIKILRRMESKS